jgi:hypothetical protein
VAPICYNAFKENLRRQCSSWLVRIACSVTRRADLGDFVGGLLFLGGRGEGMRRGQVGNRDNGLRDEFTLEFPLCIYVKRN